MPDAPVNTELRRLWMEQCVAAERIRERFGLEKALDYLVREKLGYFIRGAQRDPEYAQELVPFVAALQRIFSKAEIDHYLDHLPLKRSIAPPQSDRKTLRTYSGSSVMSDLS
jgi:hypothetical protein